MGFTHFTSAIYLGKTSAEQKKGVIVTLTSCLCIRGIYPSQQRWGHITFYIEMIIRTSVLPSPVCQCYMISWFLFCLIIHVRQNSRSEVSRRIVFPGSSPAAGEKFRFQRLRHATSPHHCRLCKFSLFQLIKSNPGTRWARNSLLILPFYLFLYVCRLCKLTMFTFPSCCLHPERPAHLHVLSGPLFLANLGNTSGLHSVQATWSGVRVVNLHILPTL